MNNTKGLRSAEGTALGDQMVCQYVHMIDSAGFWYGDDPMSYTIPVLSAEISVIFIISGLTHLLMRPLRLPKIIVQIIVKSVSLQIFDFVAFGPSNILSTFKMHMAESKSSCLQYTYWYYKQSVFFRPA